VNASEGYQLVRRIGMVTGSTVYLAKTDTGEVAIRQFESKADPASQTWRDERQSFLHAGHQGLGLTNPRIVPVLEVIDEAGEAFVVMEYMAASTLATALHAARRFTPEESDTILRQVAMALDFAHGRGVVHADLKPSDIFLTQKGAMVSDFAISPRAHRLDGGPVAASLVHGYLSPEHLRDSADVGPRSDQYSLAVIAYQMYTGQSPYGERVLDLPAAILSAPVTPPSQVDRQLPSGIDAPLLRALNRDPDRRYGSCMELVAFLGASLITQPETAGRRGSKLVYVLAPVLLLVLLALMWCSRSKPPVAKPPVAKTPVPVVASAPARKEGPKTATGPAQRGAKTEKQQGVKTEKTPGNKPPALGAALTQNAAPRPTQAAVARGDLPDAGAVADLTPRFSIDVLSRGTHRIENGSSFPLLDSQLGELGQGDLTALVSFQGQHLPSGRLQLEWTLDGVVADSKPVVLKPGAQQAMVAYGNEPSPGTYRITLKLKDRPVGTFTFRITQ
jgi:hypothetical protein